MDEHAHPHLDEAVDRLHGRLEGIDGRLDGIDERLSRVAGNDVPHASWRSWGAMGAVVFLAAERVLEKLLF